MSEAVENPAARDITTDTGRDYQPTGRPQSTPETQETPEPIGSRVSYVLRQDTRCGGRI